MAERCSSAFLSVSSFSPPFLSSSYPLERKRNLTAFLLLPFSYRHICSLLPSRLDANMRSQHPPLYITMYICVGHFLLLSACSIASFCLCLIVLIELHSFRLLSLIRPHIHRVHLPLRARACGGRAHQVVSFVVRMQECESVAAAKTTAFE